MQVLINSTDEQKSCFCRISTTVQTRTNFNLNSPQMVRPECIWFSAPPAPKAFGRTDSLLILTEGIQSPNWKDRCSHRFLFFNDL